MDRDGRLHLTLAAVFLVSLVLSVIRPYDLVTWVLEVAPAVFGLAVLAATYRRFRFTNLLYVLMTVHAIILVVGGHYTYARVPVGDWVRDAFDLSRNHYDRFGHFAQGFVPAMIARELILRRTPMQSGKFLSLLCVCAALAVSAVYELIEWGVAEASGEASADFLGTQGDIWDTQKDMAMAFLGALAAVFTLSGWHDRQLEARRERP